MDLDLFSLPPKKAPEKPRSLTFAQPTIGLWSVVALRMGEDARAMFYAAAFRVRAI